MFDGELWEVIEMHGGTEVTARCPRTGAVARLAVRELLYGDRARLVDEEPGPSSDDDQETAAVSLAYLNHSERQEVLALGDHVREVLTGFRSGTDQLRRPGEPRPEFSLHRSLGDRCQSKADELGRGKRTVERWIEKFRRNGYAGLVSATTVRPSRGRRVDPRWDQANLEVMNEAVYASKPSMKALISFTNARVATRYGPGVVACPKRTTAYRVIGDNEHKVALIKHSTKRNRDIAERPQHVYGRLRPARPGEYVLMDTTRLDVWAMDPMTLQWLQVELTVAMDWYSRCIVGLVLTPVSTKSTDSARVLFESFRPRLPGVDWPPEAIWPDHGMPRTILVEESAAQIEGGAATPSVVPETLVVDHGKIFVSAHLTSVCERLGISVQPARLHEPRDKGPVERFFGTVREDLLLYLPGYKGSDLFSRGLHPELETFYFIDE